MRNVTNWQVYAQGTQPAMNFGGRGYTGHEQLNGFGLINMNARLYDPVLARFLAPDPLVGSGMTNDFNRYIYCRNNPLMYTDPSGESWKSFWQDFGNAFVRDFKRTFGGIDGFEIGFSSGGGGFMHATRGGAPFGSSVNYNWKQQKNVDYNQIVSQAAYEGINSSYSNMGYDFGPNQYNNLLSQNVKGSDLRNNGYGAFINYGAFLGYDLNGNNKTLMAGVEMSVTYWSRFAMPKAYWIQYILTNQPGDRRFEFSTKINGNMYFYNDDKQSGGLGQYYSYNRMNQQRDAGGYAINFDDAPQRTMSPNIYTYWRANLYLINEGHPVMRITYGWTTNSMGYSVPMPYSYYVYPNYR